MTADLYDEISDYLDKLLWDADAPKGRRNARAYSEAIHYLEWALDDIEVCEDYESAAREYEKAREIIKGVA